MFCIWVEMVTGVIGAAVRVLEPILWEFEATPDGIIFRLVGDSRTSTFNSTICFFY